MLLNDGWYGDRQPPMTLWTGLSSVHVIGFDELAALVEQLNVASCPATTTVFCGSMTIAGFTSPTRQIAAMIANIAGDNC
jgi:hypothetical protein